MPSSAVPSSPDVFVSLDAASPGRLGELARAARRRRRLGRRRPPRQQPRASATSGWSTAARPATVTLVAGLLDELGVTIDRAAGHLPLRRAGRRHRLLPLRQHPARHPRARRPAAGDRHRPLRHQPPAVRHRAVRLARACCRSSPAARSSSPRSAPAWSGPGRAPPRPPSTACPASSSRRWSTSSAPPQEADVACVLKGQDDGSWSVSLRSRGGTDLARVAMALGGGGHTLAAGYSSYLDREKTIEALRRSCPPRSWSPDHVRRVGWSPLHDRASRRPSSRWRCRRSSSSRPSRCTCWSTPPSSGTSAPSPLGGLAVGGGLLAWAAALLNFLAYGTTARAARRAGAGDRAGAVAEGVQATWLALGLGLAVLAALPAPRRAADPAARRRPGCRSPRRGSSGCGRLASGAPLLLVSLAGNGWLRGVQELRRPVRYVLAGSLVSLVLCPLLVLPGRAGSRRLGRRQRRRAVGHGRPVPPRAAPRGRRLAPAAGRRPARSWSSAATCCCAPRCSRCRSSSPPGVAARAGTAPAGRPPDRPAAVLLPRPRARRLRDRRADPGRPGAGRRPARGRPGHRPPGHALGAGHRAGRRGRSCSRCRDVLLPLFTDDPAVLDAGRGRLVVPGRHAAAGRRRLRPRRRADGRRRRRLPAHGDHRLGRWSASCRCRCSPLPLGWGLAGVWTGLCLFIGLRLVGVLVRVAGDRWLTAPVTVTG